MISSQKTDIYRTSHLAYVLMAFCAIMILVMTWLPFRFQAGWPPKISIWTDVSDVINNLMLFLPLGFLYCISAAQKSAKPVTRALVFGFLFSSLIEIVQLFLSGRYTSPMDILTNGLGAAAGAWLYLQVVAFFNSNTAIRMALQFPLSAAAYLMIPLLWLASFTIGDNPERLGFLLLIGCCGVIIIAALFHHQWRSRKLVSLPQAFLITAIWFMGGTLPALLKYPLVIGGLLALLMIFTAIVIKVYALDNRRERRYEIPAVRRIAILFTLYLFLLTYWPFQLPETYWDFSWLIAGFEENPDLLPIFRLIEYLCAMTVFGYLIAEMAGRWIEGDHRRRRLWLYAFLLSFASELEFVRGLHPEYTLSILRFTLAAIASLLGASIYRRQVVVIRQLIAEKKLADKINHLQIPGQSTHQNHLPRLNDITNP